MVSKPAKSGNQLSLTLAAGQPHSPLWKSIGQRVSAAVEIDLLASFIQPSGLDLIQRSIFSALRTGAKIRILVGDYLYITSAEALRRLVGWMSLADEILEDGSLEVRLADISKLPSKPDSFHPKAWRIVDSSGGLLVVGSSNLSKAALETRVEWNLIGQTTGSEPIDLALANAFADLWQQATPLDDALVTTYAQHAKDAHRKFIPPESVDLPTILYLPRPWQIGALESLDQIRTNAYRRALVAVATGLGKTWLAAFDVLAVGKALNRQPRVLVIAHRAEILLQAEATVRTAMQSEWERTRVSWYLGATSDMSGDLVVASVQKLTRPEGLTALDSQHFDYVVIDEVHHAEWFKREGDRFIAVIPCPENLRQDFESMTAELVDYRLAHYAKTRIEKAAELTAGRFVAKVSHSGGKPILRLPTVEELPGRSIGPTTATLSDGSQWVFKFVKIACNVASPLGSEENQILPLLRSWFGDNAGIPGTNYQVAFTKSETGWSVAPVAVATPLRVVHASPDPEEHDTRQNQANAE